MSVAVPVASALDLFGASLAAGTGLRAHRLDGSTLSLPLDRWLGPPDAADADVLQRTRPPVLDVGCGPGRHVLALARQGVMALGIDVCAIAVAHARRRGAAAVETCVFERVPAAGRWGSALLLDGNVGIGGDPARLLRRVAALVEPGGPLLVEVDPPGAPTRRERLRLEHGEVVSAWFPWARVGADAVVATAAAAGLSAIETWEQSGRWFAVLAAR